jgi:hypothetical protein
MVRIVRTALGKINVQAHRQFGIRWLGLRGDRAADTYEYRDSHNSDKRTWDAFHLFTLLLRFVLQDSAASRTRA